MSRTVQLYFPLTVMTQKYLVYCAGPKKIYRSKFIGKKKYEKILAKLKSFATYYIVDG